MDKPPLRILLADDHVTVRHGLKLLIDSQPDMTVVAEASEGNAAIQSAVALKPDVVMDISMPGMNGLVATRKLSSGRASRSVTLTRHADDVTCRSAASGCRAMLKQSAPTELLQAIRAAPPAASTDSALTAWVTAAFLGKRERA